MKNIEYPDNINLDFVGLVLQEDLPEFYKVNISTNFAITVLNMYLFGRDKFLMESNYGNNSETTLSTGFSNTTYAELLNQSAINPFVVKSMRFTISDEILKYLPLSIFKKDANGKELEIPITLDDYYSTKQFDKLVIDVPFKFKIDSGTYIHWHLPRELVKYNKYNISINFFIDKKATLSNLLAQKELIKVNPSIKLPTVFTEKPEYLKTKF